MGLLPKYFSFGFRFPAYGGDLPLAEKRVRFRFATLTTSRLGIVYREVVVVYRLRTKDETDPMDPDSDIQTDMWTKPKPINDSSRKVRDA